MSQMQMPGIPPKPEIKVRYRPIVHEQARCCNCGTQWSFWWGKYNGKHSICGECAGLTYEEVHGRQPMTNALRRVRLERNQSLRDVVAALDGALSLSYLSDLERQDHPDPSLSIARALAIHYGTPLETLFPDERWESSHAQGVNDSNVLITRMQRAIWELTRYEIAVRALQDVLGREDCTP